MDWITLAVESVGLLILLTWIFVPIREFQGIFKRLKQEEQAEKAPPNDRAGEGKAL
jgi:hypothetical protein